MVCEAVGVVEGPDFYGCDVGDEVSDHATIQFFGRVCVYRSSIGIAWSII